MPRLAFTAGLTPDVLSSDTAKIISGVQVVAGELLPCLAPLRPVAGVGAGDLRISFGAVVPWTRQHCCCRSDRPNASNLVRDPGLAPGLCLLPRQVGRYLPMSLKYLVDRAGVDPAPVRL